MRRDGPVIERRTSRHWWPLSNATIWRCFRISFSASAAAGGKAFRIYPSPFLVTALPTVDARAPFDQDVQETAREDPHILNTQEVPERQRWLRDASPTIPALLCQGFTNLYLQRVSELRSSSTTLWNALGQLRDLPKL
jgi:hypothetical protein